MKTYLISIIFLLFIFLGAMFYIKQYHEITTYDTTLFNAAFTVISTTIFNFAKKQDSKIEKRWLPSIDLTQQLYSLKTSLTLILYNIEKNCNDFTSSHKDYEPKYQKYTDSSHKYYLYFPEILSGNLNLKLMDLSTRLWNLKRAEKITKDDIEKLKTEVNTCMSHIKVVIENLRSFVNGA